VVTYTRCMATGRPKETECGKFGESDIDWSVQHVQEMIAIKTFHSVAEEQGLDIPSFPLGHNNSENWYWDRIWMKSDYLFDKLIADGLLQIMALAQHHGIPTRLLDWSRDPRIAAYFAADDVEAEAGDRSEHLAVWAVNTQIFNQAGINPLTVPRFRNAYLHAQEALFTYQRLGETVNWYVEHKTLPSLLDLKDKYLYDCDEPPFIQVKLPQSEADDLLSLLYRENITKARLMPTFDSVAHTSKTLWRISPTDGRWFFCL
jgi:hypothetical protein